MRFGTAFLALREDGHVLVRKRPEAGLLGGMLEIPSTDWGDDWLAADLALVQQPVRADWWAVPGVVSHTFTHFRLELQLFRAIVPVDTSMTFCASPERCRLVPRHELSNAALPSVMKKAIAHALREH